jgi:hypothetical protein
VSYKIDIANLMLNKTADLGFPMLLVLLLMVLVVMSEFFALFRKHIKFADCKTRMHLPARYRRAIYH